MSRKIVICCDGTWNDPEKFTNIWKTFEIICAGIGQKPKKTDRSGKPVVYKGQDPNGDDYLVYYDIGVGAVDGENIRGGLFGYGLDRNVKEAYRFLAENWSPGTEIYCFGFSRGAFTVRVLTGLIGCAELIDPARLGDSKIGDPIDICYRFYRRPPAERFDSEEHEALKRVVRRPVSIKFLGVYDTVGSMGVPAPNLRFLNRLSGGLIGKLLIGDVRQFHDTRLGSKVEIARQALAIDEIRGAFKPVVWYHNPRPDDPHCATHQDLQQVWFAGSHGDVGGGYRERDLSDIALKWMLGEAHKAGLHFDGPAMERMCWPNPYGPRHNAAQGWLGRLSRGDYVTMARNFIGRFPFLPNLYILDFFRAFSIPDNARMIGGEQVNDDGTLTIANFEAIHESVFERFANRQMPANIKAAVDAGVGKFPPKDKVMEPQARQSLPSQRQPTMAPSTRENEVLQN